MNKKKKKGFTLVELLVVIAILAVLATVSILGYSAFVKKANISNDEAIVSQMNEALMANEALENKARYCDEAVDQAVEAGFILENLTPSTSGFHFAYDQQYNRFMLLSEDHTFKYGDNNHTNDRYKIHVVVGSDAELKAANEEGYSTYLREDFEFSDDTNTITTNKGIDVGNNINVKTIMYVNNETTAIAQEVVIRTNSFSTKLSIQGKSGNDGDNITHYGYSYLIDVQSVADHSYIEYGTVGRLKIDSGHVVVKEGSEIFCFMEVGGSDTKETSVESGAKIHTQVENINPENTGVTKDEKGIAKCAIRVCESHEIENMTKTITDELYAYYVCQTCGYTIKADGIAAASQDDEVSCAEPIGQIEKKANASGTELKSHAHTFKYMGTANTGMDTQHCRKTIYSCECGFTYSVILTYSSGDGSKEKPFTIDTPNHILILGDDIAKGITKDIYYKLNSDITLTNITLLAKMRFEVTEYSVKIYDDVKSFEGNFDGNNKTINIKIDKNADLQNYNLALFDSLENAVISNTILNLDIDVATKGSAVAGFALNSTDTQFNNCEVKGKVQAHGNLAGYVANAYDENTFTNCKSNVELVNYGLSHKEDGYGLISGYVANTSGETKTTFNSCSFNNKIKALLESKADEQHQINCPTGAYLIAGGFIAQVKNNGSYKPVVVVNDYIAGADYSVENDFEYDNGKRFTAYDNNRKYQGYSYDNRHNIEFEGDSIVKYVTYKNNAKTKIDDNLPFSISVKQMEDLYKCIGTYAKEIIIGGDTYNNAWIDIKIEKND